MEENISAVVETSKAEPVSLDNESGYEEGLTSTGTVTTENHLDSLIADTSMLTLQTDIDSGQSLSTRSGHHTTDLMTSFLIPSL